MNTAPWRCSPRPTSRGPRPGGQAVRVVGNHPADEAPIELYDGRYGHYVKHGGINATVPNDLKPEELTLDQAVSLLAERAAKGGGKKPARAKKAPKAKAPAKAKANGVAVAAAPANDTNTDKEKKPKTAREKSAHKRKTDTPPHRNRWRGQSRPATNCWLSSATAPRRSASANRPCLNLKATSVSS